MKSHCELGQRKARPFNFLVVFFLSCFVLVYFFLVSLDSFFRCPGKNTFFSAQNVNPVITITELAHILSAKCLLFTAYFIMKQELIIYTCTHPKRTECIPNCFLDKFIRYFPRWMFVEHRIHQGNFCCTSPGLCFGGTILQRKI